MQPWDFAGGLIILNEVGGKGSNLLGETLEITHPDSVLMANQTVHEELLQQNYMLTYTNKRERNRMHYEFEVSP